MATRNPEQTRTRLLEAAMEDMHAHGFQGMRVDEVLRHSGLRKGAFYHHFGSKTELGYAVLEERIAPLVSSVWVAPLAEVRDPVEDIPRLVETLGERIPPAMREHGCPLNNLAQEMAAQDEGFRRRIAVLFEEWVDALAAVFEQGKADGLVRPDYDSRAAARFLVAALEGCVGLFKVERSPEQWAACQSQIRAHLQDARPGG
jgi:TetR/AcrR family transcriptional repressor of nem operon